MPVQSSTQNDLFNLDLIRSYVDKELNPRFVERDWLKRQVEGKLADPDCRFVLLTAEPGAGKSAFMAWLANQHPDWCRYFIRRDQRTPLGDVGSYSFLLQVGFQLAATYPDLFKQEQIRIVVEQRIGTATNSEIVGAEIGKMFASPFYEKVIQIQQQVTHSKDTSVTGVRIGEFYATERDLPIENLQFMALFDPAKAMLKQMQEAVDHPQRQIVVLVDALDELRYKDSELSLLKWLTNCPELPANLRFVLTCRPDDDLLRAFRGSQQGRIQEISIAEEDSDVEKDLTLYTRSLIETPEVNQTLIKMHQELDAFTHQAVTKANGNFGYLGAIGRAVDEAIRQNQPDLLREILKLSELPDTLQDLYAFFLGKIKDAVSKTQIWNPNTGDFFVWETVWEDLYQPILGTLTVALEPLTAPQIQKFSAVSEKYLNNAIERLRQFLDKLDNCYRLYHSTLPEFFTSPKTEEQTDYSYCYVDAIKQNQRIVNYYQAEKKTWAEVDLKKIAEDDYGRRHLAQHLVKAERVEELHTLLSLEKNGKNAWFKVKDDEGDTASFLADIELAWAQADGAYECEPGKSIGLQCRYALIKTSINSLAEEIPPELIVALVKHKEWKPAKALAYIHQVSDSYTKCKSLISLAKATDVKDLREDILQDAYLAAQSIKKEELRAEVLTLLVDELPEKLSEILKAIFILAKRRDESDCIEVLVSLFKKLTPDLWSAAFESIQEIVKCLNQHNRSQILAIIAAKLPDNLVSKFEEIARDTKLDWCFRAQILTALSARIPTIVPEAFHAALGNREKDRENEHLLAAISLVDQLPEDLLEQTHKISQSTLDRDDINGSFHLYLILNTYALINLSKIRPLMFQSALDAVEQLLEYNLKSKVHINAALRLNNSIPKVIQWFDSLNSNNSPPESEQFPVVKAEMLVRNLLKKALEQERRSASIMLPGVSENDYKEVLLGLAQALLSQLIQEEQLFEIVQKAENLYHTAHIPLTALANALPDHFVAKLINAIENFKDKKIVVTCLIALSHKSPETFPKALKAIDLILDDRDRVEALRALIEKLPKPLLQQALLIVKNIKNEKSYAEAMCILSNRLPEILLDKDSLVLAIKDEEVQQKAFIALSDSLPSLLTECLNSVQNITDETIRGNVLIALADKLSEDKLLQALNIAQTILDKGRRILISLRLLKFPLYISHYLKEVEPLDSSIKKINSINRAKTFSKKLFEKLPQAFEKISQLQDSVVDPRYESSRERCFNKFVIETPNEFLLQLFEVTESFEDRLAKSQALIALSDRLPKAHLQALKAIQNLLISDKDNAEQAIFTLFRQLDRQKFCLDFEILAKRLKLSEKGEFLLDELALNALDIEFDKQLEIMRQAYELAEQIFPRSIMLLYGLKVVTDAFYKSFSEEELQEFLAEIQSISNELIRAKALAAVVGKLPNTLHIKVFQIAQSIDTALRVEILTVLAAKLPEALSQLLIIIEGESFHAYSRVEILASLSNQFTDVLPKALKAIQEVDPYHHDKFFLDLLPSLIKSPNRVKLCSDLLYTFSSRNRPDFIQNLTNFIPLLLAIGGEVAAADTAQAIQDVSRWWS
ncbi:PTS sugar transporter subunit IIA [Phormidium tenue]|uniref:PTS sugar transporter subunit IIA n=1 Tax=Phormidium tenue TaxID=126344 RepID=UPI000936D52D|nr:PTS sugar transporter subunit IIA [Phormidium tenue]MBD2234623.1 PTS sugar transporter subunit IIA [Phormidium tenue FACHB-1052]